MSFSVEIKGLRELESRLKRLPAELQKEISGVIENGAKVFVAGAKMDAPVDFGFLRGAIGYTRVGKMNYEVFAAKEYAHYIEWGTVTRVKVPAELQSYAIQFKGRGIKKNGGIYPHPFFFIQIPVVKKQIEAGLQAIIKADRL